MNWWHQKLLISQLKRLNTKMVQTNGIHPASSSSVCVNTLLMRELGEEQAVQEACSNSNIYKHLRMHKMLYLEATELAKQCP